MTPPPPRHNWIIRAFTAPVLRWVTWLATLILVAAIIGHWTAPTIGGIGPALLWLGILVFFVGCCTGGCAVNTSIREIETHCIIRLLDIFKLFGTHYNNYF